MCFNHEPQLPTRKITISTIQNPTSTEALKLAITVDEYHVADHLKNVVRSTVKETLNGLLDQEAEALCGAKRYERSADRMDTREGHYERSLHTTSGFSRSLVQGLEHLQVYLTG
jgi:hypothetical protein